METESEAKGRVFELRTYTANEGKLGELQARFRNHVMKLFEKHGMTNVGYWSPQDEPLSKNTLVYILAHPSRQAAKASWAAFQNDPEWKKVKAESEANGALVTPDNIKSFYMSPTEFSPMK